MAKCNGSKLELSILVDGEWQKVVYTTKEINSTIAGVVGVKGVISADITDPLDAYFMMKIITEKSERIEEDYWQGDEDGTE